MGSGIGVTQQLLTSVTAQPVAIGSAPARTARGRGLGQLPVPLPVGNPVDGPARQGWAQPGTPNPHPAPRGWDPHPCGWSRISGATSPVAQWLGSPVCAAEALALAGGEVGLVHGLHVGLGVGTPAARRPHGTNPAAEHTVGSVPQPGHGLSSPLCTGLGDSRAWLPLGSHFKLFRVSDTTLEHGAVLVLPAPSHGSSWDPDLGMIYSSQPLSPFP